MSFLTRSLIPIIIVLSTGAGAQEWEMPPSPVVVDEARISSLAPQVDVPGTVISRFDSRLASELSAKLVWIAEVGTEVKKGEAVAKLEDITFRLQEAEAQAQVKRAQARVTFLDSEVKRLQELAEQNNAAKSLLDQTISDLAVAQSEETIAQAQLGRAKVSMAVTQILAPFDGIVTERLRSVGERLNIADEVIRLVDPNNIEVVARAPLSSVSFVKAGDELRLYNDFRSDSGSIRAVVPFGNPQSHMFEVRLNVDADVWTVGESIRLAMPTALARDVLAVPRDALVLRREGISVFKIDEQGRAEQVSVTTGLGDGSLIEVIGDLTPGDRIVVRGAERLAPGSEVDVSEVSNLNQEATAKP
ncbi:MAG: efflux RND transporter periplasmic adaptor subunit [Pseudomonadota bacterium]